MLLAQAEKEIGDPLRGIGPLGLEDLSASQAPSIFNKFISGIIGLMTIIAIIWFVILMIMGAIGIISSGGDKASLETARKRITTGIIGFIMVVAAIFVVQLIGRLIGIPDLLDLPVLLERIQQ